MKRNIYLFAAALLSVLVIFATSCSNDDSNPVGGTTDEYFEVTIDGKKWIADDSLSATTLFDNIIVTAEHIDPIVGREKIEITFNDPKNVKSGTFVSRPFDNDWVLYQNATIKPIMLVSESGTNTITNLTSTYIEGTFSFVTENSEGNSIINYTNGKFKANIRF